MQYSERTLRRRAYKIGYQVVKGFQHFGRYVYHTSYGERFTGYMVRDLRSGIYEWGSYDQNFTHLWDLDDVAEFLMEEYEARGMAW